MASYRPFRPPRNSTFPPPPPQPNQNHLQPSPPPPQDQNHLQHPQPPPNQNHSQPPPPPPLPRGGSQYSQNWGPYSYSGNANSNYHQNYTQTNYVSNYQFSGYGSSSSSQQHPFQYQSPPSPRPSKSSSYPSPPPPPHPVRASLLHYPSSRFSQFNQPQHLQPPQPLQPFQPPPPPPLPTLPLPPPPPSQPSSLLHVSSVVMRMESRQTNAGDSSRKGQKPLLSPSGKKSSGYVPTRRTETEEDRRLRKKREYEKQKQEERVKQQLRETQSKVLLQSQMLASGSKSHGELSSGSYMDGDRKSSSNPLLSANRTENRLKKPTMFMCKMKFRNELPDPSAKMKLLKLNRDPDRYCKYKMTELEKKWKPQLYVEPDLGIPLDLLDMSVYNPPKGERIPLDQEDEELLRDDDEPHVTPIETNGIKKKERPDDQGFPWLVKTQYISPLSTNLSKKTRSEKLAKELRELRESRGKEILENHNTREKKIKDIMASFEACKSKPVHATNPQLQPKRILPLLPNFDRYNDQFVVANFDSAPTADSEIYSKLNETDRDEHENRVTSSSNTNRPNKFLAYMVPSVNELEKDIYDEVEDVSYSCVREYNYDVRGEDVDDPSTYLVSFGESEAKYLPLPTKLKLRKKWAKEEKSSQDAEQSLVPKTVTVRRRSSIAAIETRDEEGDFVASKETSASNGRKSSVEGKCGGRLRKKVQDIDVDVDDHFGEALEDNKSAEDNVSE